MIFLTQPRAGVIELDYSKEPKFDMASHGLEITCGVTPNGFKTNSILIDDGGDPGAVITD